MVAIAGLALLVVLGSGGTVCEPGAMRCMEPEHCAPEEPSRCEVVEQCGPHPTSKAFGAFSWKCKKCGTVNQGMVDAPL